MGLELDESAIGYWKIVVQPAANFAAQLARCPRKPSFFSSLQFPQLKCTNNEWALT